jgi:hypothetical protein
MVFNATLNNISVILCRSVLFVEEPEYPEKNLFIVMKSPIDYASYMCIVRQIVDIIPE